MKTLTVIVTDPGVNWLSANNRMWRKRANKVKAWRLAARRAATPHPKLKGRCHIAFHIDGIGKHDLDNLIATCKPILDGIVDAGIIPNDTPKHVPAITYLAGQQHLPRRVTATISTIPTTGQTTTHIGQTP